MCRGTLDSYWEKMQLMEGTVLSVSDRKEFLKFYEKRKIFNFDDLEEIKMNIICEEARTE